MAPSTRKSRARTRGPAGCRRTLPTRPDGGHEGKSSEHKRLGTVSFARVRITPPEGGSAGDAPQRDSLTRLPLGGSSDVLAPTLRADCHAHPEPWAHEARSTARRSARVSAPEDV